MKKLEYLEHIHDNDIDIQGRTLYIFGDIEEEMASKFVKNLHILSKTDGDITVYINSPGGEWSHGMAMYGAIKSCTNTVIGCVLGQCSSMASVILQSCDKRIMDKNSHMIIHPGKFATDDFSLNAIEQAKFEEKTLDIMYDIYYSRMTKTVSNIMKKKAFRRLCSIDRHLLPEDCLKLGLIDEIEEGVTNE